MSATFATLDTPIGPFTAVVDADGAVLASGWTAGVDTLLPLVHPTLRPAAVRRMADLGLAATAIARYHEGELGAKALVLERNLKCNCSCRQDVHSCQFQMQCGVSPGWSQRIRVDAERRAPLVDGPGAVGQRVRQRDAIVERGDVHAVGHGNAQLLGPAGPPGSGTPVRRGRAQEARPAASPAPRRRARGLGPVPRGRRGRGRGRGHRARQAAAAAGQERARGRRPRDVRSPAGAVTSTRAARLGRRRTVPGPAGPRPPVPRSPRPGQGDPAPGVDEILRLSATDLANHLSRAPRRLRPASSIAVPLR